MDEGMNYFENQKKRIRNILSFQMSLINCRLENFTSSRCEKGFCIEWRVWSWSWICFCFSSSIFPLKSLSITELWRMFWEQSWEIPSNPINITSIKMMTFQTTLHNHSLSVLFSLFSIWKIKNTNVLFHRILSWETWTNVKNLEGNSFMRLTRHDQLMKFLKREFQCF